MLPGPMVPTMGIMVGGGMKSDLLGLGLFLARWIFSSLKGDFTLPKLNDTDAVACFEGCDDMVFFGFCP